MFEAWWGAYRIVEAGDGSRIDRTLRDELRPGQTAGEQKVPVERIVKKNSQEQLHDSVAALLATKDDAISYFTRRDLLGESVGPIETVWTLPELQKILRKQSTNGSWAGTKSKTPVYPENHTTLVVTYKMFRMLVERYRFTRKSTALAKAAEYLFSCQTTEGDIRGFIGNQYATYYTGYVLSLLMKAGYAGDPRVERGMQWLLQMRQDDGGWTVPIQTHYFDGKTMYRLTGSYAEPVEPDRTQPFSHIGTDMVLRAFAAHPAYCKSTEARHAGGLLKSRFFKPDVYTSYGAARYWTRFVHWWPNLLTAMESLVQIGFTAGDPDMQKGLQWFFDNRKEDGLWDLEYGRKEVPQGKNYVQERAWLSLRICRMIKRFLE